MILIFSESQIAAVRFWFDPMVKSYLQMRYGAGWTYYWCLWENNQELMI